MRTISVAVVGAMLVGSLVVSVAPVQAAAATGPPTERLLVTTSGDGDVVSRALDLLPGVRVVHRYDHVLDGAAVEVTAAGRVLLGLHPAIGSVELDAPVRAQADSYDLGTERISAPAAHAAGVRGDRSVRVAVLDTGIDLDHPDLVGNLDSHLGRSCIAGVSSPDDDAGHGTHVAGTVAAAADGSGHIGVAPGVGLVPIKVLDSTGAGTFGSIICGLDHLVGLNTDADPGNDVHVANLSLGGRGGEGTCSTSLRGAICRAVHAGITVVAAAGNGGGNAADEAPAAYPEVIAVSAMRDTDGERDPQGRHCKGGQPTLFGPTPRYHCEDSLAPFSNHGAVIDMMASGIDIVSTALGGGRAVVSGTSTATPHVSATAALAISTGRASTPAEVLDLLQRTGECPNGSVAGGGLCSGQGRWFGDSDHVTEPLVHVARAVGVAVAEPPEDDPPPGPNPGRRCTIRIGSLCL